MKVIKLLTVASIEDAVRRPEEGNITVSDAVAERLVASGTAEEVGKVKATGDGGPEPDVDPVAPKPRGRG